MCAQKCSHWEKVSFPGSSTPAGEQREPEQPPQSCSVTVREIQWVTKRADCGNGRWRWECFVTEAAICAQRLPKEGHPSAVEDGRPG